jgi:hypothetical protein
LHRIAFPVVSEWYQSSTAASLSCSVVAFTSRTSSTSPDKLEFSLTLDRYSHWMPSVGRNTAEGIDEALG